MNLSLFISLRYLYARRKQVFISLISLISIAGVAIGVAALIITLSIMNGFQNDLRAKILGSNPAVVVMDYRDNGIRDFQLVASRIGKVSDVVAVSPFVYGQGMLKHAANTEGVVVKGITEHEQHVTRLGTYMHNKTLFEPPSQNPTDNALRQKIVLGKYLAQKLGVMQGDEIIFIAPSAMMTSFGQMPRWEKFFVSDVIESGMYEYDLHLAYINLETAQRMFDMPGRVTGFGVRVRDPNRAEDTADAINKQFRTLVAHSWLRMNYSLFSALKLEKIMMTIVLVLIILVASFGIISSLMLMTIEKIKDIGILKAMGYTPRGIATIFVYQGLVIGGIGTVLGLILGLGISVCLDHYKWITLPADVYYITKLPVDIQVFDVIMVVVAALAISLCATLYPALRAGKLNPSVALRYE